jgi:DNA-binding MarR family transcriptional regulator
MTETRWLTPPEREAWLGLAALMFTLPAQLDSQLQRDEDLTMAGYMVLAMLSERPERQLRMSELAAVSSTSQSRLSRIVGRLEREGFVRRSMDPEDRRAVLAHITEAGMAKITAAAPGHVAAVRAAVFDRLTEDQIDQLSAIGKALRPDSCGMSGASTVATIN